MSEKFKIYSEFIKDLSSETKDLETYLYVKEYLKNYNLNIEISSKPLKNRFIEVNTKLTYVDNSESKSKAFFEIIYATIVKIDEQINDRKIIEKIILCEVQNKIYNNLEKLFIKQLRDSCYPGAKIEKKIANNSFDFNDFRDQLYQIRNMGSMSDLISMIPGISRKIKGLNFDENQLIWTEAIINSMTPNERVKPEIINSSRKKRIALGSGRTVYEINNLIKKFSEMKKMMKKMNKKQSKFSGKRLMRKFS